MKGTLHPKMNARSSFTQDVEFLSSVEHKIRYFEEFRFPLTSTVLFPNCSVNNILQNIYCVQQKKLVQVWNKLKTSKWWQSFSFSMNYPFKLGKEIVTLKILHTSSLISTRVPSATVAKLTCISSPCTQHLCCIPPSICDTSPKPSPPTPGLSVRHTPSSMMQHMHS